MFAKCYSATISGVNASTIEIEVYSTIGTSSFAIVGLPDTAVKEAKDRIPTAIKNSHLASQKDEYAVTVNLAPADIKKEGPIYDLPIAICLLKAMGRISNERLDNYGLIGELSLSGEIRKVRGVLPMVMEMERIGRRAVLVPYENREEASVVSGIEVIPVKTLVDAVEYLNGELEIEPVHTDIENLVKNNQTFGIDFCDVKGQNLIIRAVEVAVAGGHNLLLIGSPGSGKTMIARRIPTILPSLTVEEALEVSKIHSVAGEMRGGARFVTTRPFRAPHHTASAIGMLGGGVHPLPGEVSMAHRGVLFLDEFAEFPRHVLEVLRQPLEDGYVKVSRATASHDYPSKFMLVAAMNPCPCGYYGDPKHDCRCTQTQILKYQNRISGPILDRIDIQVGVQPVPVKDLMIAKPGDTSENIRARVVAARNLQLKRYAGQKGVTCNAEARSRELVDICKLGAVEVERVRLMIEKLNLSARAYDRVLKVARTIADLAGSDAVQKDHIEEAIGYRQLDANNGKFWA